MSGKKAVDKVSKGLTSLIDEFSSAVKEMVIARWRRDRGSPGCWFQSGHQSGG